MENELSPEEQEMLNQAIQMKLESFNDTLKMSGIDDPVRRLLAVENYRLAIDPTLKPNQINARTKALLNTIEIAGCEKPNTAITIASESIESKLRQLQERVHEGTTASDTELRIGVAEAHKSLSS